MKTILIQGKASANQKRLWNAAVKATLKEVNKFDGTIPNEDDRKFMIDYVSNKISYKNENNKKVR
jgi:hypothetical protein